MHRPALAVFTALLVASVRMPAAFGTGTCTEVPGVPIALETTPQQLSQWGPANANTVSDMNRDGVVNGADLGYLLNAWGPCPN